MTQQFTSANTSINKDKIPVLFTKVEKHFGWEKGTKNFDIGGGKFDNVTEWLSERGVENIILDPYNRSDEWNDNVLKTMNWGTVDTLTLSNVLNVIDADIVRYTTLGLGWSSLKKGGTLYITCYNSGKKGESKKDCYQVAEPLSFYLDEVKEFFPNAEIKHGMIIAKK